MNYPLAIPYDLNGLGVSVLFIIKAIETVEHTENETMDYVAIVKIIEVIQMDLKPEWINKYLTTEEWKTLRGIE